MLGGMEVPMQALSSSWGGPKIRAQLAALDDPLGGFFYPDRHHGGGAANAAQNRVQVRLCASHADRQMPYLGAVGSKPIPNSAHTDKGNSETLLVQGVSEYLFPADTEHPIPMDSWPQQSVFRARIDAYKKAHGITQKQLAEELGTSLGTLRFWLYGDRRPSLQSLQRVAALCGCSVTEFIDDPGQEIAGQVAPDLTEKRRVIASMMFDGVTSTDLSDEDAQLLFEDFIAMKSRLQALKARAKK